MPALRGLLETALYAADPEHTVRFYERVFQMERIYEEKRLIALNIANQQVLLVFQKGASSGINATPGGIIPPHDGDGKLHLAFAIDATESKAWKVWLAEQNVPVEAEVIADHGGLSIYFRDPDENLLELATPGLWKIY